MKTRTFLITVTILMTSLFSNLSAQNEKKDTSNITKFEQIQISYDMKDLVTVEYLNALAQSPWKMKVRVYEESGKLLDSYVSRKKGNARVGYDISQYPAGNYTFELYKNRESVYSKVIVKQAPIAIANSGSAQNEKKDTSNITKFEQIQISYDMKDLVTVEYLNALAQSPWKMNVRVYEESGKLLDSYVSRKKGNARVGYDISQYPAGNYTFELYKNRKSVYSKSIVKQASIAKANKKSNLKPNLTNFQHVQINYDMKDLITVEYLDALAQIPWKMKVRISKESGKLLGSYISRKKGNAKVGYDISQYPAGNYTFEVYKNRVLIGSKPIVKQASIANKDSNLIGQEDSTNELLSQN